MRTLITILLLTPLLLTGQTSWQDSLTKFERREALRSYNWFDSSFTAAQRTVYLHSYHSLKHKAAHEALIKALNDSLTGIQAAAALRQQYINHLKTLGYACDNSLEDWLKAFNHPEWFGANWQQKAAFFHNRSLPVNGGDGLNDFLRFCRQYGY